MLFSRTLRQPKTLSHIKENINRIVHTPKQLLTRPLRKHRHIRQRVHTLVTIHRQRPVHKESSNRIFIVSHGAIRRSARAVCVNLVVLTVVRGMPQRQRAGSIADPNARENVHLRSSAGCFRHYPWYTLRDLSFRSTRLRGAWSGRLSGR